MYTLPISQAGFLPPSIATALATAGWWLFPWHLLFIWVVLGIVLVLYSTVRLAQGGRVLRLERAIAARQLITVSG